MRQNNNAQDGFYVRETLPYFIPQDTLEEKFNELGVESMEDGELLLLGTEFITKDHAIEILEKYSLSQLFSPPYEKLKEVFGPKNVQRLMCCIELVKRMTGKGLGTQPSISCPADALPFLAEIKNKKKEHFLCLYLNARNQVIHHEVISIGSLSATVVHPREIFLPAIQHSSASIIIAHNHPSGQSEPSGDDLQITVRLMKSGDLLGISLLDHLIVTEHEMLSLKEEGYFKK
jgi:DNA repair protein RadC